MRRQVPLGISDGTRKGQSEVYGMDGRVCGGIGERAQL